MTPPLQVELRGVGKTFGRRRVLHNISAELTIGDSLIITGHNGSGKSTLLRLLAGLQRPSSGTISYLAAEQCYTPSRAQAFVGLVGADVQLYRELTAHEHLQFVARLRGLADDRASAALHLDAVGLAGRGDERVAGFSSGMQQRLRYALALIHRPAVLLLDEPTTNLDAAGIALVDAVVAAQRGRGIVVVATNDRRDWQYGDLVLALDEDGR